MVKMVTFICIVMILLGQSLYAEPNQSDKFLKKFDKNHDNRISFAEAPDKVQENFHRHDINRDGYIKGNELRSIPKGPPPHRQGPPPHNRQGPPPHRKHGPPPR